MKKIIFLLPFFVLISSCASKTVDIKSPCVSTDGGPCGPMKPINDWWLKNQNHNSNS
jgi:hypothetical protein